MPGSSALKRQTTNACGLGFLIYSKVIHTKVLDCLLCLVGNTQLALQIIKRNQLLPSVKTLSELRKKPVFQPVHSLQPIQMPAFATVQRK